MEMPPEDKLGAETEREPSQTPLVARRPLAPLTVAQGQLT